MKDEVKDSKAEAKAEAPAKKEKPAMTVADMREAIEELGGELPAKTADKATHQKALDAIRKKMGIKEYFSEASEKQASTITETFKLADRRVVDVSSGEVYANPRQLWKAGPLNRGVKGRVATQLYAAARNGEFPIIEAKGEDEVIYKFQLVMGMQKEDPDFDAGDPLKAIGAHIPAPKKEKPAKAKGKGKAPAKGKKGKKGKPGWEDVSDEQAAADAAAVDAKIAAEAAAETPTEGGPA